MRFTRKKDTYFPNRLISKVLKTEDGISEIADSIFDDNTLLGAHLSFNSTGTKAYYTMCDYSGTAQIRCEIYSVEVNPDGTFGKPEKLPEFINVPLFTSTQPNIGL